MRLPIVLAMVAIVAALVAGPVIKNTNAAPGETPRMIKAAAMGTDAVAQTYIGIPSTSITSIARIPPPNTGPKKSAGTSAVINAEIKSPNSNALPISAGSSTKPYVQAARIFARQVKLGVSSWSPSSSQQGDFSGCSYVGQASLCACPSAWPLPEPQQSAASPAAGPSAK